MAKMRSKDQGTGCSDETRVYQASPGVMSCQSSFGGFKGSQYSSLTSTSSIANVIQINCESI